MVCLSAISFQPPPPPTFPQPCREVSSRGSGSRSSLHEGTGAGLGRGSGGGPPGRLGSPFQQSPDGMGSSARRPVALWALCRWAFHTANHRPWRPLVSEREISDLSSSTHINTPWCHNSPPEDQLCCLWPHNLHYDYTQNCIRTFCEQTVFQNVNLDFFNAFWISKFMQGLFLSTRLTVLSTSDSI